MNSVEQDRIEAMPKDGLMFEINIDRLMEVLSDILSDRSGAKITFSATPKEKTA